MLQIIIPDIEQFDTVNEVFITAKGQTIQLEHSLVSISKWESKWHKPFLGAMEKTDEETLDYIRCMTISQGVDPKLYSRTYFNPDIIKKITAYIDDPMTATWFAEPSKKKTINREIITSELIYYWMIALNIPVEFQKWHLNRLITLIKVCNVKNEPAKKMSKSEIMSRNKALNESRRAAEHSKG